MKTLQSIFQAANKKTLGPPSTPALFKDSPENIMKLYTRCNQEFLYFASEDERSQKEFSQYFYFFKEISKDEDAHVSTNELAKRAYIAIVLFGGCKEGHECETLQRFINENYLKAKNPVHDAFAAITIPKKTQPINLAFWRDLINSTKTKRAISLFSSAVDIDNKFGAISSENDYELRLTKTYPNKRNTNPTILYVYQHRKRERVLGYAFLKNNRLISGKIVIQLNTDITLQFQKSGWKNGDLSQHTLTIATQQIIFDAINATLAESEKISRKRNIEEIEILQGKLSYRRYDENAKLGMLCKKYNVSETRFNRCLELLPKNKKKDYLPVLTLDGNTLEESCHGYVLTKLPINDLEAFFLGESTDCCLSIGGHSEQCVIDGWCNQYNAFYVLLKAKNNAAKESVYTEIGDINYAAYHIVGQAYAWKSMLGNLVFDSWENLRPAADDRIAVIMLKEFSRQIVNSQEYDIYQVMIGHGGKTPSGLKKALTLTPEIMLEGYQYGDSSAQHTIVSVDDLPVLRTLWQDNITRLIANIPDLTDEEKETLKELGPKSIHCCYLLELLNKRENKLSRLLKTALNNEEFCLDILHAMIVLQIKYPEKIEETIQLLSENKLSNKTEYEPEQLFSFLMSKDCFTVLQRSAEILKKLDEFSFTNIDTKKEAIRQFLTIYNMLDMRNNNDEYLSNCVLLILHNVTYKYRDTLTISHQNMPKITLPIFLLIEILKTNDQKICDRETLSLLISDDVDMLVSLLESESFTEVLHSQIWAIAEGKLLEFISNDARKLNALLYCKNLTEIQYHKIIQTVNFSTLIISRIYDLIVLLECEKFTESQRNLVWMSAEKNLSKLVSTSIDDFMWLISRKNLKGKTLSDAQRNQVILAVNIKSLISGNEYRLLKLLNCNEFTETERNQILLDADLVKLISNDVNKFVILYECKTLSDAQRDFILSVVNFSELIGNNTSNLAKLLECEILTDVQRNQIWALVENRLSEFISDKVYFLTRLLECKTLTEPQCNQVWAFAEKNLSKFIFTYSPIYNLIDLLKCKALTDKQRGKIWSFVEDNFSKLFDCFSHLSTFLNDIRLTDNEFNQLLQAVNFMKLFDGVDNPLDILSSSKLTESQRNKIIDLVDDKMWFSYQSYNLRRLLENQNLSEVNRSRILNFIERLDFENCSSHDWNSLYGLISLLECKGLSEKNCHQIWCVIERHLPRLVRNIRDLTILLKCNYLTEQNRQQVWCFAEKNLPELLSYIYSLEWIIDLLECKILNDQKRTHILSTIKLREIIFKPIDDIEMFRKNGIEESSCLIKYGINDIERNKKHLLKLFNCTTLTNAHHTMIFDAINDDAKLSILISDPDERNALLEKYRTEEIPLSVGCSI